MTFTKETALTLLEASETNEFPVDFDAAWQWLDYSTKGNALSSFLSLGFSENLDFMINHENSGGRPRKVYSLTVDCLKDWAMMSQTEQGKRVRQYFRECEKIAKAAVKPMTAIDMLVLQAQNMQKLERQQLEFNLTLNQHDSRLEAVEYHTTGYKEYETLKGYCNLKGIDMSKFNPSVTAKLIVKFCKQEGYELKEVKDSRYGLVKAYPVEALDRYFVD